jgi:hypothetical protein
VLTGEHAVNAAEAGARTRLRPVTMNGGRVHHRCTAAGVRYEGRSGIAALDRQHRVWPDAAYHASRHIVRADTTLFVGIERLGQRIGKLRPLLLDLTVIPDRIVPDRSFTGRSEAAIAATGALPAQKRGHRPNARQRHPHLVPACHFKRRIFFRRRLDRQFLHIFMVLAPEDTAALAGRGPEVAHRAPPR